MGVIDSEHIQEEILDVAGIALYLRLSPSKIRQLIRRNAIPHCKIDGSYRFYLPVVQEWLRRITIPATAESEMANAQIIANGIWNRTGGE
jgi:excisionase family DNA binding protein